MSRSADPDNEMVHETRIIRWYIQQGDTLSYIMEHEENEHWWLAEDNKGQVVYVPVAYLMNIVDERQSRKSELIIPLYLSNSYTSLRILYTGMETVSQDGHRYA